MVRPPKATNGLDDAVPMNELKKRLAFGVMAFVVLGVPMLLLVWRDQSQHAGHREALNAYAQALVDGRAQDAHDLLCPEARTRFSSDDLLRSIESEARALGGRVDGFYLRRGRGAVVYHGPSGEDRRHLQLDRHDSGWKVCPADDPFGT
jgi:hypothetical protein